MYFLIPFLKVDGEHKWVPPKLLMFDRGIGTSIGGTRSVFLQNIYDFNLGK